MKIKTKALQLLAAPSGDYPAISSELIRKIEKSRQNYFNDNSPANLSKRTAEIKELLNASDLFKKLDTPLKEGLLKTFFHQAHLEYPISDVTHALYHGLAEAKIVDSNALISRLVDLQNLSKQLKVKNEALARAKRLLKSQPGLRGEGSILEALDIIYSSALRKLNFSKPLAEEISELVKSKNTEGLQKLYNGNGLIKEMYDDQSEFVLGALHNSTGSYVYNSSEFVGGLLLYSRLSDGAYLSQDYFEKIDDIDAYTKKSSVLATLFRVRFGVTE